VSTIHDEGGGVVAVVTDLAREEGSALLATRAIDELGRIDTLVNKQIIARDGASGTASNNVANAVSSWFVAAASGNLHLASAVASAVDKGKTITGLTDDFDGEARPAGAGIDVGADEYGGAAAPLKPQPPTDVRAQ